MFRFVFFAISFVLGVRSESSWIGCRPSITSHGLWLERKVSLPESMCISGILTLNFAMIPIRLATIHLPAGDGLSRAVGEAPWSSLVPITTTALTLASVIVPLPFSFDQVVGLDRVRVPDRKVKALVGSFSWAQILEFDFDSFSTQNLDELFLQEAGHGFSPFILAQVTHLRQAISRGLFDPTIAGLFGPVVGSTGQAIRDFGEFVDLSRISLYTLQSAVISMIGALLPLLFSFKILAGSGLGFRTTFASAEAGLERGFERQFSDALAICDPEAFLAHASCDFVYSGNKIFAFVHFAPPGIFSGVGADEQASRAILIREMRW